MIVEDNPADAFLIRKALTDIDAELQFVTDGEKATNLYDTIDSSPATPCPDLILLDINLPKKRGDEVIRHIRSKERCGQTPVLVVSSSNSPSERAEMDRYGASGYFQKPSEFKEFMKLSQVVHQLLDRK